MINSPLKTCYICHVARPDVTWRKHEGFYACERCWSDFRHNEATRLDEQWRAAFNAACDAARAGNYTSALIWLTDCDTVDAALASLLHDV
jgi:hypothetical protein